VTGVALAWPGQVLVLLEQAPCQIQSRLRIKVTSPASGRSTGTTAAHWPRMHPQQSGTERLTVRGNPPAIGRQDAETSRGTRTVAKFRMSWVEFFSLDSPAPAQLPVAKSPPTSEDNAHDAQGRKNLQDKTEHLNSSLQIV